MQFFDLGQLLNPHIVESIFCCLVEQDFCFMFLAEFLRVTSLSISYIDLAGLRLIAFTRETSMPESWMSAGIRSTPSG